MQDTPPLSPCSAYLQHLGLESAGNSEKPGMDTDCIENMAQDNIRHKFLRTLAYNNVWVPQASRSPSHQNVVIFDWDDTLICTSWLRQHEYERDNCNGEPLGYIAKFSQKLLETAIQAGRTYIITNTTYAWVEESAMRWAPELLPALRQCQIISARDRFETKFPDNMYEWKIQAFLEVQRQLDSTAITNLVVLGDADHEMEAARIMALEFEEGLIKTVKFRPVPDPEAHLEQLELLSQTFDKIIGSGRSLAVTLTRQSKSRSMTW